MSQKLELEKTSLGPYPNAADLAKSCPEFWLLLKRKNWIAIKTKVPAFEPPLDPVDVVRGWSDEEILDALAAVPKNNKDRQTARQFIKRAGREHLLSAGKRIYGFEKVPLEERTTNLFADIVSKLWNEEAKKKYSETSKKNPLISFLRTEHIDLYMAIRRAQRCPSLMARFGFQARRRLTTEKKEQEKNAKKIIQEFLLECEATGKWKIEEIGQKRLNTIQKLINQECGIALCCPKIVPKLMANLLTFKDVALESDEQLKAILIASMMVGDFSVKRFSCLKPIAMRFTRFAAVMAEMGISFE